MLRSRSVRLMAGVAAAALVLSACGSSSDSGTTTSTAATTAASSAASSSAGTSEAPSSSEATSASSDGSAGSSSGTPSASGSPYAPITGDPASVKVGMAYDGPKGDQSFTDSASAGVEEAKKQGVEVVAELFATTGEPDSAKVDRLSQLVDQGATMVIAVGFDYATAMGTVSAANPDVNFGIVDDSTLADSPNVASLVFAAEQSSYLVGVAAALKSEAKSVAFIGGVNVPLLQTFQAGFDAGVAEIDPSIKNTASYITEPPDFSGFNAPDKGQTIAKGIYDAGADIIYSAAGGSGTGVFQAAQAAGKLAIGVDSDQYNLPTLDAVKDVIMTSAVKNVNIAVYDFIASGATGAPLTGVQTFDLANGGVGISYSGGAIDDIKTQIDEYQAKIISGEITVPTTLG
ncbi:BMP family ABC transporter substrate-binding protein [Nakamurella sp. YIM 132087]|uniref:BMP family ABC transporter substrate-binding protein n=1 Tax=Nakamurella alba TaxID=2665158 RepID=A0A7K1FLI4_9ACTN|nr:BMP family ABC transporter substrate-binding protein [Nakamurella alba]MTD14249.1 BMP family ABC transporter substrate-binding protein [Nakamurella alba]